MPTGYNWSHWQLKVYWLTVRNIQACYVIQFGKMIPSGRIQGLGVHLLAKYNTTNVMKQNAMYSLQTKRR